MLIEMTMKNGRIPIPIPNNQISLPSSCNAQQWKSHSAALGLPARLGVWTWCEHSGVWMCTESNDPPCLGNLEKREHQIQLIHGIVYRIDDIATIEWYEYNSEELQLSGSYSDMHPMNGHQRNLPPTRAIRWLHIVMIDYSNLWTGIPLLHCGFFDWTLRWNASTLLRWWKCIE